MADRLDELKAEQRVANAHRFDLLGAWERRYADDTGWLIAEVERLRELAAAVVAFVAAEEALEEAARHRRADIGPEAHRAYVERAFLRAAAKALLGEADRG